MSMANSNIEKHKLSVAIVWVLTGTLGFFTAFLLINEVLLAAQNQDLIVQCDINSVLSCSPNFFAPAGNLLGFPNSLIGVALFPAPIVTGLALLFGARGFNNWFWRAFTLFASAAYGLCVWFQWFSIWGRRSLCPICEVTWVATIFLFWYTIGWVLENKKLVNSDRLAKIGSVIYSWGWVIALGNIVIVLTVAQIFLNWLGL